MPHIPEPLLEHIPPFLMVMFRLTGLFVFAPLFGSNLIPMKVKALLAFVLALCIYPMLGALDWTTLYGVQPLTMADLPALAVGVGSELLIGIAIGYGASIPLLATQFAGKMIDSQMGLAMAEVMNPELNMNSSLTGQILFSVAFVIFLMLNGHHVMLLALIRSFELVPLGGFIVTHELVDFLVGLLMSMSELAVRLSAPILCLLFLQSIAMGLVAKTVPQLNILSLGFPLRIILGMVTLVLLLPMLFYAVHVDLYTELNHLLDAFSYDALAPEKMLGR